MRLTERTRAGVSGFSLIEALVALTMLAAGILLMGTTLTMTSRAARDSLDGNAAAHLVRHKVDELRATPYGALRGGAERITLDDVEYTRRWSVRRDDPAPGVTSIDVEVTWSDYAAPLTEVLSQPVTTTVTSTLGDPLGTVSDAVDGRGRTLSRSMSIQVRAP